MLFFRQLIKTRAKIKKQNPSNLVGLFTNMVRWQGSETVFFDLAVEGSQPNLEQSGSLGFISFGKLKYPANMSSLHGGHFQIGTTF